MINFFDLFSVDTLYKMCIRDRYNGTVYWQRGIWQKRRLNALFHGKPCRFHAESYSDMQTARL